MTSHKEILEKETKKMNKQVIRAFLIFGLLEYIGIFAFVSDFALPIFIIGLIITATIVVIVLFFMKDF